MYSWSRWELEKVAAEYFLAYWGQLLSLVTPNTLFFLQP